MNQPAQDHAFVLRALLAAAHITASVAAAEAMSGPTDVGFDYPRHAAYALAMSQISLACIWVVMGRFLVVLRWGALISLFGFWLPLQWRPFENNYVLLNNMVWQAVALVGALVARHWRGWRIVNVSMPTALDKSQGIAAKQFYLEHLFLLMTVVAAGIGAARFLDFGPDWRTTLLLAAANAVAATAIGWATLSTLHSFRRLASTALAVLLVFAVSRTFYDWKPFAGVCMLHGLLLAISLWVFRLCGFRLCRSCEL